MKVFKQYFVLDENGKEIAGPFCKKKSVNMAELTCGYKSVGRWIEKKEPHEKWPKKNPGTNNLTG